VVGAGHLPGIRAHWDADTDLSALEALPRRPDGRRHEMGHPASIVALIVAGFFYGGKNAGTDMIRALEPVHRRAGGLGALLAWRTRPPVLARSSSPV